MSLHGLGFLHYHGLGVERDITKAHHYFETALKEDGRNINTDTLFYLGMVSDSWLGINYAVWKKRGRSHENRTRHRDKGLTGEDFRKVVEEIKRTAQLGLPCVYMRMKTYWSGSFHAYDSSEWVSSLSLTFRHFSSFSFDRQDSKHSSCFLAEFLNYELNLAQRTLCERELKKKITDIKNTVKENLFFHSYGLYPLSPCRARSTRKIRWWTSLATRHRSCLSAKAERRLPRCEAGSWLSNSSSRRRLWDTWRLPITRLCCTRTRTL